MAASGKRGGGGGGGGGGNGGSEGRDASRQENGRIAAVPKKPDRGKTANQRGNVGNTNSGGSAAKRSVDDRAEAGAEAGAGVGVEVAGSSGAASSCLVRAAEGEGKEWVRRGGIGDDWVARDGDDGVRGAGRSSANGVAGDEAAATENGVPAAMAGEGRGGSAPRARAGARTGGSQERGKKRTSEAEFEGEAEDAPSQAGGGGGGGGRRRAGRTRGKVPRGRNNSSAARAATAAVVSPAPAVALENGSSGRRTRGRSPG